MDKTGIISEKLACSTWQEREEMLFDLACRLDSIKKRENFAFCDMRDAKTEKEKKAAAVEWREACGVLDGVRAVLYVFGIDENDILSRVPF